MITGSSPVGSTRKKTRDYIAKAELIHGNYYKGTCRNAAVARWNAETGKFLYWRNKFNDTFLETISPPEDEEIYDVFYAKRNITGEAVTPIPLEEN